MDSFLSNTGKELLLSNVNVEELLSRSVEIQIYNHTRRFTLRRPRTYFNCGLCSMPPFPCVPPGSTDTCRFPGNFPFWGVAGILVYEAESFTLAIYFSNPIDYTRFSMDLGLEVSLGKAHKDLEATYARMAEGGASSCPDTECDRVTLTNNHGAAEVSNGPVRVMASMSNTKKVILKVVVEEQGASGEGAR